MSATKDEFYPVEDGSASDEERLRHMPYRDDDDGSLWCLIDDEMWPCPVRRGLEHPV